MDWPTDRCAWCLESGETLHEITVRSWTPIAAKEESQTLTVHDAHEEPVRAYFAQVRRSSGLVVYTILGVILLLMILAQAALTVSQRMSDAVLGVVVAVIGGLTIVIGGLLVARPLPTDLTIRWLGIRRAVQSVRAGGVLTIGLGVWILYLSRTLSG